MKEIHSIAYLVGLSWGQDGGETHQLSRPACEHTEIGTEAGGREKVTMVDISTGARNDVMTEQDFGHVPGGAAPFCDRKDGPHKCKGACRWLARLAIRRQANTGRGSPTTVLRETGLAEAIARDEDLVLVVAGSGGNI